MDWERLDKLFCFIREIDKEKKLIARHILLMLLEKKMMQSMLGMLQL